MLALVPLATNWPQLLDAVPPVLQDDMVGPVPVPLILKAVPGVHDAAFTAVNTVAPEQEIVCENEEQINIKFAINIAIKINAGLKR